MLFLQHKNSRRYPCGSKTGSKGTDNAESDRRKEQTGCTGLFHRQMKALQSVIPFLPKELDAPVVLVQHMPPGFTKSMADRLDDLSKIRVKEAEHGERLQKGCVYIAPGGKHLKVAKTADGNNSIVLDDATPAIGGLKPCANLMYDSLTASSYDEIVCVVLTGMGADGTNGILSLGRSKPIRVIAQNEETCVVYGMPKAIYEAGVVDEVVPLDEVAQTITKTWG